MAIEWDKFTALEPDPEKRKRREHFAQATREIFTEEFTLAMSEISTMLDENAGRRSRELAQEIESLCRRKAERPRIAMLALFRAMLYVMCEVTYDHYESEKETH